MGEGGRGGHLTEGLLLGQSLCTSAVFDLYISLIKLGKRIALAHLVNVAN